MPKRTNERIDLRIYSDDGTGVIVVDTEIACLCEGIMHSGALAKSAKKLGISYSRAWKRMVESEASLGFPLLDKKRGIGTTLTPQGAELVRRYNAICRSVHKKVDESMNFREFGRND